MKMLITIAWRNIWRSKLRSAVVIGSIALGIWAGMFIIAFSWGMYNSRIQDAVENEIANIQIHDSTFTDEFNISRTIPEASQKRTELLQHPSVKGISNRNISMAMIASARGSSGIRIMGVDTAEEKSVSGLPNKIEEGKYLRGTKSKPIVIGHQLADKLKVKLKSSVVITLTDSAGEIVSTAFKVVGIYKTANSKFEELNAYALRNDLQEITGMSGAIHEMAISLHEYKATDTTANTFQIMFPGLLVQTWGDILPEMAYANEMFDQIMNLIIFIIMLALAFGIVNTMLMAILERVKEIGMLMAVGMNRVKIFSMIMLETFFLTIAGLPAGLLLSYVTIGYLGTHGINLGMYAEALGSYGFQSIVFLKAEPEYYGSMVFQVFLVAVITSIFPARRALKLNPVESIRAI
jgi:ABC-type lipoprotein release transport system permease subunit